MSVLYALFTALLLFVQGPIYKLYNFKCVRVGKTNDYLLNVINFGVGLTALVVLSLFGEPFDLRSVLYGLINGIFFCSMLFTYNKSLQLGNIALVNFVVALSMVIPLFTGVFFWNETISTMQYVGLSVLIVAAYLVCYGQRSPKTQQDEFSSEEKIVRKKQNIKLWLITVFSAITNGLLSVFIKFSYIDYPEINQTQFLSATYFASFIAMVVLAAVTTKGFSQLRQCVPNKWFVICGCMIGAVTVCGNYAYTFLSVITESTIFYPIVSALPMLLAAVISPLLKEKLSKMSLIGIVLGVAAIVILNL